MVLRGARGAVALPIQLSRTVLTDGDFDLASAVGRSDGVAVLRGEAFEQQTIPHAFASRCALGPLGEHETRTYVERRFAVGATATFVGCKVGRALSACHGGGAASGHLALGTSQALIGSMLSGFISAELGLVFLSIAFSIVAAITALVHLYRYLRLSPPTPPKRAS
jgi:hypothetical protein